MGMRRFALAVGAGSLLAMVLGVHTGTRALADTKIVIPVPPPGSGVSPANITQDRSPSRAQCKDYFFPVTALPAGRTTYRVFGRLCTKTPLPGRTVQVLLHGGSYNHTYWDWPYRPETYSYVGAATSAGYATLDLDRLGYGYSDHPNPALITYDSDAWVAHQVIRDLRTGALGLPFRKVVLVGHSYGSIAALIEAGRYRDVDGLILSGLSHYPNFVKAASILASFYPVELDPKFRGKDYPPGYTTSLSGTRGADFYYPPGSDPKVVALDEKHKDVIPVGEDLTIPEFLNPWFSKRVVVPVLDVIGDFDNAFCGGPRCSAPGSAVHGEGAYYPSAPCFKLYFQPDSGHDNNLHRSAPRWFAEAATFLTNHVGAASGAPASPRC